MSTKHETDHAYDHFEMFQALSASTSERKIEFEFKTANPHDAELWLVAAPRDNPPPQNTAPTEPAPLKQGTKDKLRVPANHYVWIRIKRTQETTSGRSVIVAL